MSGALWMLAGGVIALGASAGGQIWWRRRRRREPEQWFRPSEARRRPDRLPPAAAPGPRPMVGQRAAEGTRSPRQRQAHLGARNFRAKG